MKLLFPVAFAALLPCCAFGQNLAPNPSFEVGTNTPVNWSLSAAAGQLQFPGHSGSNCVNITADGSVMSRWSTPDSTVTQGLTYAVRFWTRMTNVSGGSCFGGFNTVYSDFSLPGSNWTNYGIVAYIPNVSGPYLNVGQTVVNGTIFFDDVEMYRVTPVHKLVGSISLGAGEKIQSGKYTYTSDYDGYGGSYARCLQDANTTFASFRWYMNSGSALVYRHDVGGLPLSSATVKAGIWNYNNINNATLQVEASTNGSIWFSAGAMSGGASQVTVSVPTNLLPAAQLYIRLKSTNSSQFSLTDYSLTANVATNLLVSGATCFAEQRQSNSIVTPLAILDVSTGQVFSVRIANAGAAQSFALHSDAVFQGITNVWNLTTNVPAASTNTYSIALPAPGVGQNAISIAVTNGSGSSVYTTGFLFDTTPDPTLVTSIGNLAPNPSFEIGTNLPASWDVSSGTGTWGNFGRTNAHCVSLTGTGSTLNRWYTYSTAAENGKPYVMRFWTSCSNSASGGCIAGFNTVYTDFPLPSSTWTNFSTVFWIPNVAGKYLNVGQVSVNGTINFDDIELYPVLPIHKQSGGQVLGAGEKLETGRYTYQSGYASYGGSYSRCLTDSTTTFATFRWYMNPGSALIYRHNLTGRTITNATLKGGIWNYNNATGNSLLFDASTNGLDWVYAGALTGGAVNGTVPVPTNLFPASDLFVRLRSTNAAQFSLTNYVLVADLATNSTTADGVTYFLEQRDLDPVLVPLVISDTPTGQVMTASLVNNGGMAETYSIYSEAELGGLVVSWGTTTNVAAGQSNIISIFLPSAGIGDNNLLVSVTNSLGSNVFNTSFVVKGTQVTTTPSGAFGNLVPNPSFELGTNSPIAWFGWDQWHNFGHTGSRCVSATAYGFGVPKVYTLSCPVDAGTTYAVHYWTMASNAVSGATLGGFNSNYRDFGRPPEYWVRNTVVDWMPSVAGSYLNLGLVTLNGTIFFDDVEVYRTIPTHKQVGAHLLGAGESVSPGKYSFGMPTSTGQYSDYAGNYARSLQAANTSFASFRWYMNPGSYVIHKHELDGLPMTNATVKVVIWNYNAITNTSLEIEVSTNGADWQLAGFLTGTNAIGLFPTNYFNLPASLFPTPEMYVRMKSSNPAQFSLTDYAFTAGMPGLTDTGTGETYFFEQKAANAGFAPVSFVDRPGGRMALITLSNATSVDQAYNITSVGEFNGHTRQWTTATNVPAFQTNTVDVFVPTAGFGENYVTITVSNSIGSKVFENSFSAWVSILADDSYGACLPSPIDVPVWFCGPTYKIGRTRALPLSATNAVQISAARNEYEPFQLALRPLTGLSNVTVSISDFTRTGGGGTIVSTNVTMNLLGYVPVTELYNALESSTGDTPDPLLPITVPFSAPANTNTTVWFTVKTPKDIADGLYTATVTVQHAAGNFTVPVELKVYDFSLSDATHHENINNVVIDNDWHLPANDNDRRAIWELYLADIGRHRSTPYLPQKYQPIESIYVSSNNDFTFNFTNFDSAMARFLDEYHFNAFQLLDEAPLDFGIGPFFRIAYNGQGQKIINPGYKELYPRLLQPVYRHVIEKGWFPKAYNFWVDEPAIDNSAVELAYVQDGFRLVGDNAPGLPRLLPDNNADFPKPALFDEVEIWSPGFDNFSYHVELCQQRQAAGEKIWPYCYVRPFSPWPNNFIDQPAASPRIRQWIAQKLGWDGDLYWGINYYFTIAGYGKRNPWTTPFTRYGAGVPSGNSDGSLVYPPQKNYPTNTLIAGPIDSVRWENLREGIEDREYFWVLKQSIAEAQARLGASHPSVLAAQAAQSNALAFVPWPPAYPYEAESMAASRDLVAQTIESLNAGRPLIAEQPTSKAAYTGESVYLKVEALGWPMPVIQWQHAGTNLPGALGNRLYLNNASLDMAGQYRAVITNNSGSVTSAVVNFSVIDASLPPQVLLPPATLARTNGSRAVFGVVASSVSPMTYQWLFNGNAITGATNMTLVLTNIGSAQAGSYSVIVSNAVGATTNTASLVLPAPPTLAATPVSSGVQISYDQLSAAATVQFSTNLTSWQTLTNLPATSSPGAVVDRGVTNSPFRYYRILLGP
ncbi:MAG: hypothetical protein RLY20_248 [Verrucomicrobiota bacterium]|jgi:hypothetical protein